MKFASKKPSKPFVIIMSLIAATLATPFIIAAFWWIWANTVDRKYQDESFKKYERTYGYCDGFFGGNTSREEIYERWQNDEPIGC